MDAKVFDNYPRIKEWLERCKKEIDDHQELNQAGSDLFGQIALAALAKIQ